MGKNFTLTFCAAIALSVYAQAQSVKPVPRPLAPGLEFKADKGNRLNPFKGFVNNNRAFKRSVRLATAPRAPRAETAPAVQVDTLLATSKKDVRTGGVEVTRAEVEYDDYGRRKTYTEYDYDGAVERRLTYEYTTGGFNYWTKKVVKEEAYGETKVIEQEEREYNEDGRITLQRIYRDNGNGGMFLAEKNVYDYSHGVLGENSEGLVVGFLVEKETFLYDSEVAKEVQHEHVKYQWFEPAKNYVEALREYRGVKNSETVFGEDFLTEITYGEKSDGTSYKHYERTDWYANGKVVGQLTTSYNEDGSVESASGTKATVEKDLPAKDWTTVTQFAFDQATMDFVPSSKTETFGTKPYDGKFYGNYEEINYEYQDGQFVKDYWMKYEEQAGNIYKATSNYNPNGVYFKCDKDNNLLGDLMFNKDNSYVVTHDIDDGDALLIYYFTAGHQLERTIKRVEGVQTNVDAPEGYYGSSDDDLYTFYILKDGKWEILDEYESTLTQGSMKQRTVYKYTEQGYPASVTTYVTSPSYNGGKEFISTQYVYTYQDNGYILKEYGVAIPGKDPVLDEESTYFLLEDGTYVETTLKYDGEAEPYEGQRKEIKDGIQKNYTYNESTKKFDLSYVSTSPYTTIAEDGTKTTIEQAWDEAAQKAVPRRKTVSRQKSKDEDGYDESFYEEYSWDETTGKWIGQSKSHNKWETVKGFVFDNSYNIDPIGSYSDEYKPSSAAETENISLEQQLRYSWDETKGDWGAEPEGKGYSYTISGNTLNVKRTERESSSQYNAFDETYVAEGGKLISKHTVETGQRPGNEIETYDRKDEYTYNKYGVLQEEKHYSDGEYSYGTKYLFTEATIKPMLPPVSGITGVEADAATVTVNGREVTATDGGKVTLYSTDGRVVATGNGTATAPAAGIFIAKVGSKAAKVVVK